MPLKYVTLHQAVISGCTEGPSLCSWSPTPLVFKKSRLLPSFPGEHSSCPFHLNQLPVPQRGLPGLDTSCPQGAPASARCSGPAQAVRALLPFSCHVQTDLGRREEAYNRQKLKTQSFHSHFPGPRCGSSTPLCGRPRARASLQPWCQSPC